MVTVRLVFFICFIQICCVAFGQEKNCAQQGLPKTKIVAFLKGLPISPLLEVSPSYFNNGIELILNDGSAKVVGYTILRQCPSSDYTHFNVCGSRMDSSTYLIFKKSMDTRYGSLSYHFESITIEVSGKRYEASEFTIVPKLN